MKLIKLVLISCIIYWLVTPVQAVLNPTASTNNIFGIHLAVPDSADIQSAGDLVNSSGGDWGYVTLVIQENDREVGKWQAVFDDLRREHLIPIIRLATSPQGEVWRQPEPEDADSWLNFLNSLNWVVKNRYIILFNEPNHASEWGGQTDPETYRKVALAFAKKFKQTKKNYFIMLAGFDQIAPHSPSIYMDEAVYLQTMFKDQDMNKWTNLIDGLSSHSYPNPGFSGSPFASGRNSVRGYEWELGYFNELGFSKELPVFITETGWQRFDEFSTANNFEAAYLYVWLKDPRIIAVTPFVLNYQGEPFLGFSWQKPSIQDFYQQYYQIKEIKKIKGNPEQITDYKLIKSLPTEFVQDSEFVLKLKLDNTGESIWDSKDGYAIKLITKEKFLYHFVNFNAVEPGQSTTIDFYLKTPLKIGKHKTQIILTKNDKQISKPINWLIHIVPNVDIELAYSQLFSLRSKAENFQVEIYDENERLIYIKRNVSGNKEEITLKKIKNVAIGEKYRIVLLKPYYLPRQAYLTVKKQGNKVKFKTLFPLDWNKDGKWSWQDLLWFQ